MATEFGNTSAKRAKLSLPEPSNPTEKEQRQKSPTKYALMNGNITERTVNIGRKSRTHSPKSRPNSPKLSPHSPKGHSPKGNATSSRCGLNSPKSSVASPKDSAYSPKGGGTSPKGGGVILKAGGTSLKAGGISPKAGGISPKAGNISPKPSAISPKAITISPKGSTKSPKGSLQSPRSNQHSPKGGQHSPRNRPHSPKVSPGPHKLQKPVDNNNHGGIFNTLHIDVDLANNKLTVSPVDGRRCHSDSRISIKKSRSIPASESKKRKLEFTEIKNKRTSPPGKKRRTDSTGNSSKFSPSKQVDGTVDHNQNIQVVGVGSSKRRNSWDNSLHSPDQYKSIHSIGSRKAVMKVATYSDTILTSTRKNLPACTASFANGVTHKSEVQVAALDLSMASIKDHSSLSKKQVKASTPSKPQPVRTVLNKPEIVVSGESETSSIESDPTDKYEKVDTDILFKKDAIAKTAIMDAEQMEQEINSTADKERSSSTPSSEVYEDGSDKEKRSLTPESEGDDSAFSTDDTPSTEGEQKQLSKGKQPKRVAKKYADLQPRAPRKRRMASLTAETKNLLLFDKDITAPLPAAKKSTGGEKGRKRKREESQTSQSGMSDGTLLQTCNHLMPQGTKVTDAEGSTDMGYVNGTCQQCGNSSKESCKEDGITLKELSKQDGNMLKELSKQDGNTLKELSKQDGNTHKELSITDGNMHKESSKEDVKNVVVVSDCNSTVSKPTQVVSNSDRNSCLDKDVKGGRTQSANLKQAVSTVPKPAGSSKAKPNIEPSVSTSYTKKDVRKDVNTSKSPSLAVVSSSVSKSAQLLLSRRAAVDSSESEKLTAISSTTSITSPLLLRMSRHSTDGASSGDESAMLSPTGFDPRSITLLQPGGIITGNFNGQSASNHYIPKSRVLKKIIKPANLKPAKLGRRHSTNGWKAIGEPVPKPIILLNETIREVRLCYESIRRKEDVIQVRDCVLLRSGVKRKDLPFVAKVSALWEDPESGEIMMSLLWYYRPEHTEAGRRPYHTQNELFACRHWDINSVACIEDKCYVLTPAEYNRYRTFLQLQKENYVRGIPVVPEDPNGYPRQHRLPQNKTDPDSVFLCRQVYDFRQKRVLKNPY